MDIRKHQAGTYRVDRGDGTFGQVKRVNAKRWDAEVRDARTGAVIRYAGIWRTRAEAVDEAYNAS